MEISKSAPKTVLLEPFVKLVKLVARAFYDDYSSKGDNQLKAARSDNRGIAVVVLDALSRRQWVREEDLAKELKLHTKQLRRMLKFFEDEKLVMRENRKETAKGVKMYSAAVAATTDLQSRGGEEKVKLHTHSYCCLDYAQIYDVVRYRIHRMKKKLKDEMEDKNSVQEYVCPNCRRKYNALDALQLISMEDDCFHCENCNGELIVENDKLTSQDAGDGDDNARKLRREKLKELLQKVQLKPLMDQINRVKDLQVPEFGSLQAWEAHAALAARGLNGDANSNDPSRSSQGGYGSTPMPFLGETKVEVNLGEGKEENVKSEGGGSSLKVLPPWMIKQGMSLTKEQRGEFEQESKADGSSSAMGKLSDDKKSAMENDNETNLQDEYVKAYYAALLKKQQELSEATTKTEPVDAVAADVLLATSSGRQVGMKSKREDEEDEDVEWEGGETTVISNSNNENYKVGDLNVEAEASADEDEDVDWEEG
ncbi:PREDICTED: general transcription factor IIE subunit 1-like isoform X2 [Tarenaya hassleriana]|uniref:general transcription factor IIE subunit 1-like isoform X2 n=1 Tax=Tarenaya hassleriana TaxID=28532 RepID=UPI00053C1974|nr:PREDICTED: general transcription factor IIE subunit 1-like isoform X2 [Tarenaya hassleriana]